MKEYEPGDRGRGAFVCGRCGKEFSRKFQAKRHENVCRQSRLGTAMGMEELRRISADNGHLEGVGPSMREYDDSLRDPLASSSHALQKRFGTWENALAAAGLRMETRGYYIKRARERNPWRVTGGAVDTVGEYEPYYKEELEGFGLPVLRTRTERWGNRVVEVHELR